MCLYKLIDWQSVMKWHPRGWGIKGLHICSLTTLWKDYHGGLRTGQVTQHSAQVLFLLPHHLLFPIPHPLFLCVHSQWPHMSSCWPRVSSGGDPYVSCRGATVRWWREDGHRLSHYPRWPLKIRDSAFLPLNQQSLFISGPWARIKLTSVTHKSKKTGRGEERRKEICTLCFSFGQDGICFWNINKSHVTNEIKDHMLTDAF